MLLPALVDRKLFHSGASIVETVGQEIADEEAVRPEEQRIVVPASGTQGILHLGPNRLMFAAVVFETFRSDLQDKAHASQSYLKGTERQKLSPF